MSLPHVGVVQVVHTGVQGSTCSGFGGREQEDVRPSGQPGVKDACTSVGYAWPSKRTVGARGGAKPAWSGECKACTGRGRTVEAAQRHTG